MRLLFLFLTVLCLNDGIYQHTLPAINSGTINLNDYRGKFMLIVNIASGSSYVQQLGKLQQFYELHSDSLVVIAVPSNNFGHEQKNDSGISQFLDSGYQVTYPVATLSNVTGQPALPLYQWLTAKSTNQMMDCPVIGDFQKFLINRQGKLVGVYGGTVDPMGTAIAQAIRNN